MIYNARLLPKAMSVRRKTRIRDIPASKTVLVSVAWGIVTALLPAFYHEGAIGPGTVGVFLWVCALVFVQTAFFDIMDMQGSRIVGKETIPILLGEKRSMTLLKFLSAAAAIVLAAAAALNLVAPTGLVIALCPAVLLAFLYAHEHGEISPGFRRSFLMQSHFILAGVLALAANYLFT